MARQPEKTVEFTWKDAVYRIRCAMPGIVQKAIIRLRGELEAYIHREPSFVRALEPVALAPDAPEIVRRMHAAALLTGVGPMAAVAGCIAQMAAEAALAAGAPSVAINNGGDIFLAGDRAFRAGIYPGPGHPLSGKLVMEAPADRLPLGICASSGRMGHSYSRGSCDLAVVLAADAALADAAATLAANLVRSPADVAPALERAGAIPGIEAVMIIQGETVGLRGSFPPFVRNARPDFEAGVVRHPDVRYW